MAQIKKKAGAKTRIKVNKINNNDNIAVKEEKYLEINEANEANEDNIINKNNYEKPKSLNIYRKIAISFLLLTGILLAIIFYFSFVKVTIKIEPREERLSDSLNFDLHNSDESFDFSQKDIAGVVQKIKFEEEKIFKTTGEEVVGEEIIGEVTIINNNNKNQILVATTRLLTTDNKLFRIKKTVNIPAGGSLSVEIYADEVSSEMAIGPSTFTIPGLWAGLQDKIYAKSDKNFVYQKKINKFAQKLDIENAANELKKGLLEKAKNDLDSNYNSYDQIIYELDENSIELDIDVKTNEKVEDFKAKAIANVVIVAYNSEKIIDLAKKKLESIVPDNKKLTEFNKNNIVFTLNNYNIDQGVASVSASFEGMMILKDKQQVIDKNMIVGLNKEQLESYLSRVKEIKTYQISFSPAFIDKVPKLTDRIKIE